MHFREEWSRRNKTCTVSVKQIEPMHITGGVKSVYNCNKSRTCPKKVLNIKNMFTFSCTHVYNMLIKKIKSPSMSVASIQAWQHVLQMCIFYAHKFLYYTPNHIPVDQLHLHHHFDSTVQ